MSTTMENESNKMAEKRAKRFWIALVVFLFIIQSTIMGSVMHLAIGDPSSAVVPDYHNRALNWDALRHTQEAAGRLGWDLGFKASDVVDGRGMRAIELRVVDAQGKAVDGLSVSGTLYHHARAGDVLQVSLPSAGEGRYIALAPASRPGQWQLELSIVGGSEPVAKSINFNVEGS